MSALKIQKNKEKIVKLLNENIDLEYNLDLKRYKRFSEEVKNIGSKKEPKEVKVKIYANKECLSCSVSFKPLSSVAKRCADCAKTHKAKEKRASGQ